MQEGRSPRRLLTVLAGTLLAWATAGVGPAFAQAERWTRYVDPDSGLSFDFPAHVFSLRTAQEQQRGTLFSTPDGRARILAFGTANRGGETPTEHLRATADFRSARFTYVRTGSRFFVVSGTRRGRIFYRRCNFTRGGSWISCFHVEYPQAEKRAWDRVVTRMSRSLRQG